MQALETRSDHEKPGHTGFSYSDLFLASKDRQINKQACWGKHDSLLEGIAPDVPITSPHLVPNAIYQTEGSIEWAA